MAYDLKENFYFPRRYRLVRRVGFSQILQKKAQTNLWFAIHSEVNTLGHARLGISVSKRLLPTAIQRNSIKRLIREAFRLSARRNVARDVVIRLRKSLVKADYSTARVVLNEMLNTTLAAK